MWLLRRLKEAGTVPEAVHSKSGAFRVDSSTSNQTAGPLSATTLNRHLPGFKFLICLRTAQSVVS